MAAPINFESSSVKDEEKRIQREQKKAAQKQYLEKVKSDHEKKEKRKEEAKKRGEDTWMLPALTERLEKDKKKKKKHRKEKKKKKKKDRKDSTDGSSASEDQWVEKNEGDGDTEPATQQSSTALKRDDWLSAPGVPSGGEFVPTYSRADLRAQIQADKEEKRRQLEGMAEDGKSKELSLDKPGLHHLELNPFWKDGGTGLPEEEKKSGMGSVSSAWLKKALTRVEQQAQESETSLEELAAQKWGSLKTIKKIIKEAEIAERQDENIADPRRRTSPKRRPRSRSREQRRSRSRSRDRRRKSRSRSRDRRRKSRSRSRDRRRSGSPESRKVRDSKRKSRSRSKSRDRRKSTSRSPKPRKRHHSSSSSSDSSDSGRRRKTHNNRRSRSPDRRKEESRPKPRFMRPGKMNSEPRENDRPTDKRDENRKRAFRRPDDSPPRESSSRSRGETDASSHVPRWKKKAPEPEKPRERTPSSSSSSESESEPEQEVVKIMTEAEMNALGAKIVKAELMGDDERAAELKAQLDSARQAAANAPKPVAEKAASKEVTEVVLTKTTKTGLTMPVSAAQSEQWGGRKGKKKKVATHSKSGERERYFADDDKFTLKQMFEREKMGTSEDSDRMFARLSGRGVEKTDDDYQIDDAYLKRATTDQSEAQQEEKDRAAAISEHKKTAQAIEKCQLCLDKCSKHLIIAIGVKSYVSLPGCASLTEGHCRIVPIHHSPCATQTDEDVWQEIQVFRQALSRMFSDQDLDCVFMETALGLRRHPHMMLECVPMPRETGDMAPIYFKKAIQEHGDEWAQNKKLVDLRNKDIRHAVPKGFPYFSVDFGTQGGYAHVIEDEQTFPRYFGKEIVGGMLDLEPGLWRSAKRQSFEDQRKKVLKFAEWWKPYDWTTTIKND